MKRILVNLIFLLGLSFVLIGCEEKVYVVRPDHTPPSVPKGFCSITADEAVWLFWDENDEQDFAEYRVYRAKEDDEYYKKIARTQIAEFHDHSLRNGTTYFYAVSAVDYDGNESGLSETFDTPRPEGFDRVIHDFNRYPDVSGFDFSTGLVVGLDDPKADIFLEYDGELRTYFLWRADEYIEIQDFGFTENLDDVNVAPDTTIGWSNLRWIEAILGHSYIIWDSYHDNYAKLRITEFVRSYGIVFDWAYQIDEGNPELAPKPLRTENNPRVAANK